MNIFKTFETFLKEPLSVLRDNIIQIVSIQTGNIFENKPSCDVTVMKDKTQITVVNNEKLYKFLSIVNHKANSKKVEEKPVEEKTQKIIDTMSHDKKMAGDMISVVRVEDIGMFCITKLSFADFANEIKAVYKKWKTP